MEVIHFDTFRNVDDEENSKNILTPPSLNIPILYVQNAFSEDFCTHFIELLQSKSKSIYESTQPQQVAGLNDGLTTRWLDYNILEWEEGKPIREAIKKYFLLYLKLSESHKYEVKAQCWINDLKSKQNLSLHSHNYRNRKCANGTISLQNCKTITQFVFPFPLESKKDRSIKQHLNFETTLGHMIIVPGWLPHFTTPVPNSEERWTLGFDISDRFTKGRAIPLEL